MKNEMFMVGRLAQKMYLDTVDGPVLIEIKWAKGMIGAIAVFDSREAAEKYAPESEITELMKEER